MGKGVFEDCEALESVVIPASMKVVPEDTFYDCSALSSVTLGKSVISIGESAFYRCPALKNITLHERVVSIGKYSLGIHPGGIYKDFTITGKKGSTAEKYATSNKITFIEQ
jgi:hypothetical protein